MKRRRAAWLVGVSAGLAIAALLYRGPGHEWTRAHLGDALAVSLMFGALALATTWSTLRRATVVAIVAVTIELCQLSGGAAERSPLVQLFVGGHFDLLDFLYYGLGLASAVGFECCGEIRAGSGRLASPGGSTRPRAEGVMSRWRFLGSRAARARGAASRLFYELLVFGVKQAWACLFGAVLLALILGTHFVYPENAALARYDFLVIAAVAVQVLLLASGLETLQEAKVILIYHAIGTVMEVFKIHVGSWSYPEPGVLRIAGVPLFSGFMYASVGSYIARVWRLFEFRFRGYPPKRWTLVLAVAIYANFFTHHLGWDGRWLLFGAVLVVFGRCWVYFRIDQGWRSMPLVLGFVLVALFLWLAENIATLGQAWSYPHQQEAWQLVAFAKMGSWLLLMIVSFVVITLVHQPRPVREPGPGAVPIPQSRQPPGN